MRKVNKHVEFLQGADILTFKLLVRYGATYVIFPLALLLAFPTHAVDLRWFELVSEDVNSIKPFYEKAFGWEIRPSKTRGAWIASLQGKDIAGISQIDTVQDEIQESQWFPVLYVADIRAAAASLASHDAEFVEQIAEVDDYGSYTVIRDPQGSILMLTDIEAIPPANETPGNWLWGELWTNDADGSAQFYDGVAGLFAGQIDAPGGGAYDVFAYGDELVAGMVAIDDAQFATRWGGYIGVLNLDTTVAEIKRLGGEVFDAQINQHGAGRVAVVADPIGAVFFIYEMSPEQIEPGKDAIQ